MKYTVTLIFIFLFSNMMFSQNNDETFEALWQQVDKLEAENLTKSALTLVETIGVKAKKENNSPQIIKTLLYRSNYAMTLEEDAQLNIVNNFKSEINAAQVPAKNVLESYLANLYWEYFKENRYRFYNRSTTDIKVDSVDFRTWDLNTLFNEITYYFDASLKNESQLQQIPVSEFYVILDREKGSEDYRPTLFDLLAQNALTFFSTSENNITRPAEIFTIDDPEFLCDAQTFSNLQIKTADKTSLQAKALKIYQQLIKLHLLSEKPYALAEVDIQRLQFIYKNAVIKDKEQQYLDVLQNSASAGNGNLASSLYNFELASNLNQQGNNYNAEINEENRWKKKAALEICNKVILENSGSRGAEQCQGLKTHILSKSVQLTVERNIPVNTVSRILVKYRNYDALKLTASNITEKQLKLLEKMYDNEEKLSFIKKLPVISSWAATLKNEKDYQDHSTEITIPELANGRYIILALPNSENDKTFSYSTLQVTNLALVETQTNTHQEFQVIDRTNGKPAVGAHLFIQYRVNYKGKVLSKTYKTDKTGKITIQRMAKDWNDISITVSHKNETAFFNEYYMNRSYDRSYTSDINTCFLFTDRSIYRPGQPLYFKGIAVKKAKKNSSLLVQNVVTVSFNDVNGQTLQTADFTTNEYGSFHGEFIIPNNGLTGQFSMQVTSKSSKINGYTSFSVEEYKRPKFETNFKPITDTFRVNDSITVHGNATAYAGSTITDAKVTYSVKRVVYYPRWYYWQRSSVVNNTPQEIIHGETKTDALGNYSIVFKAIPDTATEKTSLPTFRYEVTADVTDINGETHSTTTTVSVGYHTLTAQMFLANPLDKEIKDQKITIITNNLNGQFAPATGTVKMYKLMAPEHVLRPRPWPAPDYPGFTEAEFKKLYPHEAFGNEHDAANWEKGEMVWQSKFDTGKTTELSLGNCKAWVSGKYVLELETSDKFGQKVKDVLQTTLYGQNDKKLADNELFHIKTDKNSYSIGEKVKLTLSSNAEDVTISVYIEKNNGPFETKIIRLNKNSETFSIPVLASDLGGFAVSYSYASYNYFNSNTLNIHVPYPSSALQIETVTFRDKIKPGTDETWSFKIKGPKGDKVSAELLASMYDASLDAFRGHSWNFYPINNPTFYSNRRTNAYKSFLQTTFLTHQDNQFYDVRPIVFDSFEWFGLYFGQRNMFFESRSKIYRKTAAPVGAAMEIMAEDSMEMSLNDTDIPAPENEAIFNDSEKSKENTANSDDGELNVRKNLQETAFFFPHLQTDAEGSVSFSFTSPEALTRWNLQLLGHTKSLESSYTTLQTVTQKELMVMPNAPRFLREGDEIVISSKIANLSSKALIGRAQLELVNALTAKDISSELLIVPNSENLKFKVDSMGNTQVSWRLKVPENLQAVQYKVIAKAGDFSDGEQNILPVLSNRTLVTETLPMWVRSDETKTFVLDKLKTTSSKTLKQHKLTLEITSNPAWYAVQALPYLMEYPYDCSEQTFSRYYANTLATHIANRNPRIKEVFNQWANSDALVSNLEKNEELKSLLVQETPWLRDAQSETEQKKRIALLFNLNKMKGEQENALRKLRQNQKSSGAWPWFNGGPDNRFITQHIIAGMGHLQHLQIANIDNENASMIQNAITYLDAEFVEEYEEMKKHTADINADHLNYTQIHYLYMRSFFPEIKASKKAKDIQEYYFVQAQKYWKQKGLYAKGMLTLALHRNSDRTTSEKILRALEENSITSEELGMYWKENIRSWYWHQAPIETQALLIEAFSEISPKDITTIDNLKIWLLKNKQTNQWQTTKATTEAVYALLLQGNDWLSVTDAVEVLVGGKKIEPQKLDNVKVEAGTGYYKTAWNGKEIAPKMAEVQITKKGNGIAWGALYWQYFEDLDKITMANTPLQLKKKLFLKKNTKTGEEISEITDKTHVEVGDLVRIRIELRADRPMEFIHMKDMRAAGFEPVNVISQYKWQDGLGYYEATKDASTNFFFDYLPKGVFIFEYEVRVNNAGNFSNGITTIQSMYAPEFSSHSEGLRILVDGAK